MKKKKKLLTFFSAIFFFGTFFIVNKSCGSSSPSVKIKHNYQMEQLYLIGIPEKTTLVREKRMGRSAASVSTYFIYKTTLSENKIINYYKRKLSLNAWKGGEFSKKKGEENERKWSKNNYYFTLRFKEKEDEKYIVGISWTY